MKLIGAAPRADAVAGADDAPRRRDARGHLRRAGCLEGGRLDRPVVMVLSVMGFSVPVFVVGYMLIYVFAIKLRWLPVQGYQPIAEGVGPWLAPCPAVGGARHSPMWR